jgi:hypothetical protein
VDGFSKAVRCLVFAPTGRWIIAQAVRPGGM